MYPFILLLLIAISVTVIFYYLMHVAMLGIWSFKRILIDTFLSDNQDAVNLRIIATICLFFTMSLTTFAIYNTYFK